MTLETLFRGDTLIPGALRGYRTWQPGGPRLLSTGVTYTYGPAGTVETATCRHNPNLAGHGPSPQANCTCGFYAWYAPADSRIVNAPIFGAVRATGHVVLGTHGFRAQHLQVLAVTTDEHDRRTRLIDAGFTVYPTRQDLLADYPPDDISSLIDHHCDHHCAAISVLSVQGVTSLATAGMRGLQHAVTNQVITLAERLKALAADTNPDHP